MREIANSTHMDKPKIGRDSSKQIDRKDDRKIEGQ